MKAIKKHNNLIATFNKVDFNDISDSYSYDVAFFVEFERFDRHDEKLMQGEREGSPLYEYLLF